MAKLSSEAFWGAVIVVVLITIGVAGMLFVQKNTQNSLQEVREGSRQKSITNNLRQIASAGMQYILEEGVSEAYYDELEGEYFARIDSVDGERYDDIVVYDKGGVLRVTTSGGMKVAFTY